MMTPANAELQKPEKRRGGEGGREIAIDSIDIIVGLFLASSLALFLPPPLICSCAAGAGGRTKKGGEEGRRPPNGLSVIIFLKDFFLTDRRFPPSHFFGRGRRRIFSRIFVLFFPFFLKDSSSLALNLGGGVGWVGGWMGKETLFFGGGGRGRGCSSSLAQEV